MVLFFCFVILISFACKVFQCYKIAMPQQDSRIVSDIFFLDLLVQIVQVSSNK